MDLTVVTLFILACHTIAINIVQFRHRNDQAPSLKAKRKIVVLGVDMPVVVSGWR